MTNALDHCGIKLYVHFLDLYRETEKDDSVSLDDIHNALFDGVTGCEEVCLDHQCWLVIEPDLPVDLESIATKAREEITAVFKEMNDANR